MRALVLNDWWDVVLTQHPAPHVGDLDVLIGVIATGICGSDLHGFTGENGRRRHGQVMGHETVGRVVAVGSGVGEQVEVGAVVTVNPVIGCGECDECAAGSPQACDDKYVIGVDATRPAAFAELLVAPAANVVLIAGHVPIDYGALVEPLAVGYHAIRRVPVNPGDTVLVIGAGPIGQACVIAAFREGARAVAVSELNLSRRDLVTRLGASFIDPRSEDLSASVVKHLGGRPTAVIDAVGSETSLRDSLACAPLGAAVVLVGMAEPTLTVPAYDVSTKERSLIGSFCYTPDEFRSTAAWIGETTAALGDLIEGRVSMTDAPDAFRRLAAGEWSASKVLVYPNGLPE